MPLKSERRFISISNIKSGMMLEFSYTDRNKEKNTYQVIVIDPDRRGTGTNVTGESYLHALLIDNMSDMDIIQLAATVGVSITLDADNRNSPITDLQSDSSYEKYVLSLSSLTNKRIYRTFIVKNISSPRQILIGSLT